MLTEFIFLETTMRKLVRKNNGKRKITEEKLPKLNVLKVTKKSQRKIIFQETIIEHNIILFKKYVKIFFYQSKYIRIFI